MKYSAKKYRLLGEFQAYGYIELNKELLKRKIIPTFYEWVDSQLTASQIFHLMENAATPWELQTFHQKIYGLYQTMVHETIKSMVQKFEIEIID